MSAPSIPNLLSLRGSGARRGQRGRGRGGGAGGGERGGGLSGSSRPSGQSDDLTIQGTDSDAAASRLSAVNAGYLEDPYARCFVSTVDGPPARRFPIINRGTYTRTTGIDSLVNSFLSANEDSKGGRQIISLGAGTDTRPFRLFQARQHQNLIYHEIDFPIASANKLRTVQSTPQLDAILPNRTQTDAHHWTSRPSPNGSEYHSHGLDIRSLHPPLHPHPPLPSSTTSAVTLPGLRTDVPTLLLSECCLCYLHPEESDRVMAYFSSRIPDLSIVIYEPMHLGDPFSDTMTANLAARGILMPGLEMYRDQKDQEARLRAAGFQAVRHMTVDRIWDAWVGQDEKERVDGLEGLDEVEEWKLLAGHYLVIWGSTGSARALGESLRS